MIILPNSNLKRVVPIIRVEWKWITPFPTLFYFRRSYIMIKFCGVRYRLVSLSRFVVCVMIMLLVIACTILNLTYSNMDTVDAAYGIPTPLIDSVYTFYDEDINISTKNLDEYVNFLYNQLHESLDREDDIRYKYNDVLSAGNKLNETTASIYNEYKYVLEYPSSDFTLNDITMVLGLCNKYYGNNKNFPHLWFSLVQLESSYCSSIKMPKTSTARGWGQVLDRTGQWLYEDELKLGKYNHATMGSNKQINATMSIYYLSKLINQYGVHKALISYNGGEIGERYVNIIAANLKKNSGLSLADIEKPNIICSR